MPRGIDAASGSIRGHYRTMECNLGEVADWGGFEPPTP